MGKRPVTNTTQTGTNVITTEATEAISLAAVESYSFQPVVSVGSSAVNTFVDGDVDVDENSIADEGHGLVTGRLGQLTSTGTLPAGLSLATDYYTIVVDDDNYKFASSLANALAGTAVVISAAAGGGTHTFTPTAISASVTHQLSNDGTNWTNVASATAITTTANFHFTAYKPAYTYARLLFTLAAGLINYTNNVVTRGDRN